MSNRQLPQSSAAEMQGRTGAALSVPSFRNNNFDLLRILAAMQVLWSHAYPMLGVAMPSWQRPLAMFPGVTIFFVVSGYLVSSSLERQADLQHYFKNRLLRIYPGLWVCVTVALIVGVLFGFHFHSLKDLLWYPAQLLGFVYTPPALSHFGVGSYDSALWTIPIELQFYVVLPVVYWIVRRTRSDARGHLIAFLLFTAITVALYHFLPSTSPRGSFGGNGNAANSRLAGLLVHTFVPTFYLFLFGVVLQRGRIFQSRFIYNRGLFWLAGYVLLRVVTAPWSGSTLLLVVLNLALGLTVISLAYTATGLAGKILREQDISYGVYIYQCLLINVMIQLGFVHRTADVLLLTLLTLAAGAISWRVVERPILRWKGKRRVVAAATVAVPA